MEPTSPLYALKGVLWPERYQVVRPSAHGLSARVSHTGPVSGEPPVRRRDRGCGPFADHRWPQRIERPGGSVVMDTYHRWMEVVIYAIFAGLPCISVPAGFNAAGLPMGLQIIGKPQADLGVLRLASSYEQVAQDVLRRVAPSST